MALSRDEKIAHLQKIPVFRGCSRQQLVAVAHIADITDVPAGKALTVAGETGNEFSIILEGTARVGVWGRKRVRLGPGDFFGEMSLLDGEPCSATVVAETPLRLLVIPRRGFWALLARLPGLTRQILVALSGRVRQAEKSLLA